MRAVAAVGLPAGVTVDVTGRAALDEANTHGGDGGSSVLLEALIGGLGALLVLLFVFGTLPAVLMPLVVAVAAILNTFTLVWALTYFTDVSIIVQFLIALVGLGVAIDYALLMIFRFRDELRDGNDVESALVETMTHAGRSVILSGTTVALGLLSLLVVPLPLLRSMSLGGMLIPVVSVLAATTLLPALLAVAGTRINSVRVMPRRFIDRGHPEDGAWGRWARFVIRRPVAVGLVGLVIVAALAGLGTQLNVNGTQLKYFPGTGTAIAGRDQLAAAGISPGVMKPLNVLVENGGDAAADRGEAAHGPRRRRSGRAGGLAARIDVAGRGIPRDRRRRPRHPRHRRPRQRQPEGDGRQAHRHRRDRPRLPARAVRQLPLRHRAGHAPDPDPAHPGVPLDRARAQGRGAEPVLARRGVRHRRLHLPAGARLLALERRGRRSPSPPTSR